MTALAAAAALIAAVTALVTAITALIRQVQQGRQVTDHETRLGELEPPAAPKKPGPP